MFWNLAASFVIERSKYSSSSTVPFRPDPTLRSIFRFERELRLGTLSAEVLTTTADAYLEDDRDKADGATVYRVKAVGAMEISVMTSTL